MAYICGVPRAQAMLLPECVEDFVGPENPVRVIDLFVDGLDLAKLGWPVVDEGLPGAPSYDPRMLLQLFLYGYLNRLRSSRELEKATYRNLEVIWRLRRLTLGSLDDQCVSARASHALPGRLSGVQCGVRQAGALQQGAGGQRWDVSQGGE